SGRIVSCRLTWHAAGGDQVFEGGPVPVQTLEGQSSYVSMPQALTGVEDPRTQRSRLEDGPSPVQAGHVVRFRLHEARGRTLEIFDLSGRRLVALPFQDAAGGSAATWDTREHHGYGLPAGLYLARVDRGAAVRVVVLGR